MCIKKRPIGQDTATLEFGVERTRFDPQRWWSTMIKDIRNVIRAMPEKLGHEVVEAAGGTEAIHLALGRGPDMILMDLRMPDVDGCLAAAALRTISSFVRVPFVATTAFPKSLSRAAARAAGCDAYLEKPLSLADLTAVLEKFQDGTAQHLSV
jgi:two-component system cell cycle response regulator DivK